MSNFFRWMKNPLLCRSLGRRAVRTGMKGSLGCRSPELRASGTVGLRWQAIFGCQIVWNRSTRRAGARGRARVGRPRWLRILLITGGSSMAAMIFKEPPQLGQCSMSMSKTRLHAMPDRH